ncbi:hypothetical protein ACFQAT_10335 [Undibacterium arcticum]|uniref:Uncharacterized protein n=1 Tax=Undibacterium arcticum TaxID=1762892 RepID=A0ABV7EX66_9BURK
MNIQSRNAIEQHAREAYMNEQDDSACRYPYGSTERNIWIDEFVKCAEREEFDA